MDSHSNFDFPRLRERASEMLRKNLSTITAGEAHEQPLGEWEAPNGVHVKRLPDDEQGILRVSVGGGIQSVDINYCVFRGDPIKCAFLLDMAAAAIRETVKGNGIDHSK